jgi:hypothetical protein
MRREGIAAQARTGRSRSEGFVSAGTYFPLLALFLFSFPTEKSVAIESDETEIRQNSRDAAGEDSKRDPAHAADDSKKKSGPTFFREEIGGDHSENHADPIGAFESQENFCHG